MWQRSGGIDRIIANGAVIGSQRQSHASDIELARLANDLEQGMVDVKTTQTAQAYFNLHWGEATPGQPPLMLQ
jgi:hypothetical protein